MFASVFDPNGWAVLGGCVVMIVVLGAGYDRIINKLKKTVVDQQTQIDDLKRKLEESKVDC